MGLLGAVIAAESLAAFVAACVVILAIPGPDMAYIGGHAMRSGRRAGLLAATGTVIGASLHALAASLGVSAIFAASPLAFEVVRWAGVAYLAWLGVQTWRRAGEASAKPDLHAPGAVMIVAKGTAINVLNPKVALFFLAFLPQFADPAAGSMLSQMAVLGGIFAGSAAIWCTGLALVFAWLGRRVGTSARVGKLRDRLVGALFVTFAGTLAVSDG
ncbi:LysE family translocator [Roseobacter sp. HKCCA0434]|uniref:LysE family translocator n=1 Tax=Roseobacter sp. HKCCA0434 TaxID=3079297 RepID=UPI002905F797|nr:LysE family translocator [Roseobacter sp. HKCCA0434]